MIGYKPELQCTLSTFYVTFNTNVYHIAIQGPLEWAPYQIRKIAGCACAGNVGNVFPRSRFQRKPLVSDPGMHHGTRVTHVPWSMSGSLTCGDGENVPGIPGACAPAILRISQEAHERKPFVTPSELKLWTFFGFYTVLVWTNEMIQDLSLKAVLEEFLTFNSRYKVPFVHLAFIGRLDGAQLHWLLRI